MFILKGEQHLQKFCADAKNFNQRHQVQDIVKFIQNHNNNNIIILQGIARTGKITILKHAILDLSQEEREKVVLIVANENDIWKNFYEEIIKLYESGIRNILIDEITEVKSLTKNLNTLTNLSKARIVCSGSNVLALQFVLQKKR